MAKATRTRLPKPEPTKNSQVNGGGMSSDNLLDALNGMSSRELLAVIEKATAVRATRMDSEKKAFFDRVRAEASELGISLDQIVPPAGRGRPRGKSEAPVKFKGPNDHDTWTGRGRMPNWLAALEAEGRSRDEFLVRKPD